MAIGDVNGDGRPDVVTSAGDILLGNGDGTLQAAVNLVRFGAGQVSRIALADLNRDGRLDVVATADPNDFRTTGSLRVFLGLGGGAFPTSPVSYTIGKGLRKVAVAGGNGDGIP